jgi:SH3-like domain-containing protein
MRWCWLTATIFLLLGAPRARGLEFPYTAYVNTADVYVRSGPGRDYYPTDKLQKGEKVEVYRHDPGGWYAIRPPRHSFSWVSVRNLDLVDDSLATVNTKRAVARVGSVLGDVRDVIQVRLDKGEKVELIEPPASESPWCKIAPPAGEFRWVFSKFVDSDLPADLADDERDAHGGSSTSDPRHASDRVRLASGTREPEPATDAAPPQSRLPLSTEGERQKELERIDLELSTMVSADISTWSLGDLARRAEQVLSVSDSSVERGRAHVMLSKLAKFDDIKVRHDAIRRVQSAQAGRTPALMSPGVRGDDPRFDGVGRLAPVVSQKTGGPQYALVDASNAVITFITPAPGVNLRPYVDKYVGVSGQRGYLTDLQRQHISVQRVTLLDVERR